MHFQSCLCSVEGDGLSKEPRALLLPLDPPEISLLSSLGPAQTTIAKDLGLRIQIIQK